MGEDEPSAPAQPEPQTQAVVDAQPSENPLPGVEAAPANPEPEPPISAALPQASGAEGMLEFAREHFSSNPLDFAKSRDMFSRAKSAGSNTPIEFKAEAEIEQLDAAWRAHAQAQWQGHESTIRKQLEEELFDAALASVDKFDDTLASKIPDELNAFRGEIKNTGAELIAASLATARAKLDGGELNAAKGELAKLTAIAYEEGLALAQAEVERINAAIAAASTAQESAAQAAWLESERFFMDGLLSDDQNALRSGPKSNSKIQPKPQAMNESGR